MAWFRNLKVGAKLLCSFAVVLLLTIVLGVFSIVELAKVNGTATDMQTNWLPSVQAVDGIALKMNLLRRIEFQLMLPNDAASVQKYETMMKETREALDKIAARYEKLISSPEEKSCTMSSGRCMKNMRCWSRARLCRLCRTKNCLKPLPTTVGRVSSILTTPWKS